MISAMVTLKLKDRKNRVMQVILPRRILTALRSMRPEGVELTFGGTNESLYLDADALNRALVESRKRRPRSRR